MNAQDRKLVVSIALLFVAILIKYMLWDVYATDFIGLSDFGYSVVQWLMTLVAIVSAISMVWYGLIKKGEWSV